MYHKLDSCELDRLIKKAYKVDFNAAYYWLQDERKLEVMGVSAEAAESNEWCKKKLEGDMNGEKWDLSQPPLHEYILNDLCAKGKLKAGDYFIVFDD